MTVRAATEADESVLRELWEEFEREVPTPAAFDPESWDEEWVDLRRQLQAGNVFLAEEGARALGLAKLDGPEQGAVHVQLVHVRPEARRRGVAKGLLRACVARGRELGARTVSLHVLNENDPARAVWGRLGFAQVSTLLAASFDELDARLVERPPGEHRSTTHVQSDDHLSVERAVAQFLPRLEAPELRNTEGWIRISDPLLDVDRDSQARFARELSERLGAITVALALEGEVVRFRLYERGRMVDEYLSVPAYYGALSTGDELALAANPTVVSRLTGADREEVRRVARVAASPSDLPPAAELYGSLAALMGLEP